MKITEDKFSISTNLFQDNNTISQEYLDQFNDSIKFIGICGDKFLFKFKINNEDKFFEVRLYSSQYRFILTEHFYGSELWNFKYRFHNCSSYYINIRLVIELYVNEDLINSYLNKSIGINLFISNIYEEIKTLNSSSLNIEHKSYIPYCDQIDNLQNFKVKLFPYQKKSLKRMSDIENNTCDRRVKITNEIELGNQIILYDPILGKKTNKDTYLKIFTKGGILSDQMGLGKTITSLALISKNKSNNPKYFKGNKIYSKATLLVCPSHLTTQWKNEYKKCFKKSEWTKVHIIATKKNHEKLTNDDIKNANLIILSDKFLINFKYYPCFDYKPVSASTIRSSDRIKHFEDKMRLITSVQESMQETNYNNIKNKVCPIIENFHFHRIIVDEGHEIFGESCTSNHAQSLYLSRWFSYQKSDNFWFVSGTPFYNVPGYKNCLDFIKLKLITENNNEITYKNGNLISSFDKCLRKINFVDNLLRQICIRHRKDDVKDEVEIPGYNEEVIWVEMTEFERKLYDSKVNKASKMGLQQLCCHPLVADSLINCVGNSTKSLEDIQDDLIKYHENRFEKYKNKIENLNENATEYSMLKKTYQTIMTESKYLLVILKKINTETEIEENCVICFDNIENPVLTPCGHMYCYECLNSCLEVKKICPICNGDLKGKDLILINETKEKKPEIQNPIIKKYGSKLGKIILMIRKLLTVKDNRIIVFSQWDRMLNLISNSLAENGIENSFVKGNVWNRNAAIKKFKLGINNKGDENKVIMLSLKNSASGTNLTEATHIFFVEPIDAPKMETKSIEGQAIGRACRLGQKNKINVIRVLTRNTIEEEIYNSSYRNDEIEIEI